MPKPGDHVAYFYIPLDQPLIGVVGPFAMELSPDQWPSRLADVADSRLPKTPLDVSIAFVTSDHRRADRLDQFGVAAEVAARTRQAFLGESSLWRRVRGALMRRLYRHRGHQSPSTVVEAAVTLPDVWEPDPDGPDDALTAAMDSALVALKLLLLQVCSVQPGIPRVLPTPESLPALIPFMVCEFIGAGESPRLITSNGFSVISNDLGAEAMTMLYDPGVVGELAPIRNTFVTYWSLRNEAAVLLQLRGQYRSSLLLVAAAAENMLDSIGQLLMWSDGLSVESAAQIFGDRSGPLKRAGMVLGSRIGGGWRPAASSPVGDWVRLIVHPRNEAVHAGADVSREAAWQAWHALDALRLHVGGLLMKKQSRYPMAALAVSVSLNLSSSPNGYAPRAMRLLDESPPGPGQLIVDFERWQREMVFQMRAG